MNGLNSSNAIFFGRPHWCNFNSGPTTISGTSILRATAFEGDARISQLVTRTFLFTEQVLRQPAEAPGFPSGRSGWNGYPAAYAMDPRVVDDPRYQDQMRAALQALPTLSLVLRRDDLFGSRNGIYVNSLRKGLNWERSCSAEFYLPDGSNAFQVNCGVRIQGNTNRRPDKTPKFLSTAVQEALRAGQAALPTFP